MGFWKKLAGVGSMVGGVVGGVLTANPLLATAGISAGTSLLANDAQSESAKKALAQQQQATDKGLEAVRTGYDAGRAALQPFQPGGSALSGFAPYSALGTSSIGSLAQMAGLPVPSAGPAAGPVSAPVSAAQPMTIGALGGAVPRNPSQAPASSAQSGSSYVMVQSPDRKVGRIPAHMLDQALAMGGKLVQ